MINADGARNNNKIYEDLLVQKILKEILVEIDEEIKKESLSGETEANVYFERDLDDEIVKAVFNIVEPILIENKFKVKFYPSEEGDFHEPMDYGSSAHIEITWKKDKKKR